MSDDSQSNVLQFKKPSSQDELVSTSLLTRMRRKVDEELCIRRANPGQAPTRMFVGIAAVTFLAAVLAMFGAIQFGTWFGKEVMGPQLNIAIKTAVGDHK
jgi:hypothetical protein